MFEDFDPGWTDGWFDDFDTSFDFDGSTVENNSFWDGVWEFANSNLGAGLIKGVGGGLLSYFTNESADERSRDQMNMEAWKWNDERKLRERALDISEEQVAIDRAKLEDTIRRRNEHNESIAKKPKSAKGILFG